MRVYCDFDGTISVLDTTDHVLSRLAAAPWQAIEAEWLAGRIDAARCMREQVALIGGDDAALDAVLDVIGIDPGFQDFAIWCAQNSLPITIVSDGVDRFIRRVLARHGFGGLPIVSNRLAGRAGARRLLQPHSRPGCPSGVCKCAVTEAAVSDGPLVYVGDGRSDFCVSARADILFAKGDLAAHSRAQGRPHHVFRTFHDVTATLDALMTRQRVAAS